MASRKTSFRKLLRRSFRKKKDEKAEGNTSDSSADRVTDISAPSDNASVGGIHGSRDTLQQISSFGSQLSSLVSFESGFDDGSSMASTITDACTSYPVSVRTTIASTRAGMTGSYLLQVNPFSITLIDIPSQSPLTEWPIQYLRRYGRGRTKFSFEAGDKCKHGKGVYTFNTLEGDAIFHQVDMFARSISLRNMQLNRRTTLPPGSFPPIQPMNQASKKQHHSEGKLLHEGSRMFDNLSIGAASSCFSQDSVNDILMVNPGDSVSQAGTLRSRDLTSSTDSSQPISQAVHCKENGSALSVEVAQNVTAINEDFRQRTSIDCCADDTSASIETLETLGSMELEALTLSSPRNCSQRPSIKSFDNISTNEVFGELDAQGLSATPVGDKSGDSLLSRLSNMQPLLVSSPIDPVEKKLPNEIGASLETVDEGEVTVVPASVINDYNENGPSAAISQCVDEVARKADVVDQVVVDTQQTVTVPVVDVEDVEQVKQREEGASSTRTLKLVKRSISLRRNNPVKKTSSVKRSESVKEQGSKVKRSDSKGSGDSKGSRKDLETIKKDLDTIKKSSVTLKKTSSFRAIFFKPKQSDEEKAAKKAEKRRAKEEKQNAKNEAVAAPPTDSKDVEKNVIIESKLKDMEAEISSQDQVETRVPQTAEENTTNENTKNDLSHNCHEENQHRATRRYPIRHKSNEGFLGSPDKRVAQRSSHSFNGYEIGSRSHAQYSALSDVEKEAVRAHQRSQCVQVKVDLFEQLQKKADDNRNNSYTFWRRRSLRERNKKSESENEKPETKSRNKKDSETSFDGYLPTKNQMSAEVRIARTRMDYIDTKS